MKRRRDEIIAVREKAYETFTDWNWETYQSGANFLFTRPTDLRGLFGEQVAFNLFNFLNDNNVLIRYFPQNPLTSSFVRISIGKQEEMDMLVGFVKQMENKRSATVSRQTNETQISVSLNLDGSGQNDISTGIPFLDHMLQLFSKHGFFDLNIKAKGDIEIDYHHLVEDMGLTLGQAFKDALSDKAGIKRYGFFILPMDETLVTVALDLSNRAFSGI